MLDQISDLPGHPLLVHAVVFLVPLAAIGAVLVAVWPKFSRRFGAVVVNAGVATFVVVLTADCDAQAVWADREPSE